MIRHPLWVTICEIITVTSYYKTCNKKEYLAYLVLVTLQYNLDISFCLTNQAWGPYWRNISPRSWQYGLRSDIHTVQSQASLVNKRLWLKIFRNILTITDWKIPANVKYRLLWLRVNLVLTDDFKEKKETVGRKKNYV